jgi:PBSX family phage portal protein
MARRLVRKINTPSTTKAAANSKKSGTGIVEGGIPGQSEVGYTSALSGLTSMENMKKGIYGLFHDDFNLLGYDNVDGNSLGIDVFRSNAMRIVVPLFPYRDLIKIYNASTILRQCVDSYVTNIESYGLRLEYCGPDGQEMGRAAQNERQRIMRLLGTITTDGRTLRKHREESRIDKEVLGARCFEVIEDAAGRVVSFEHVPMITMRMTMKDREATEVTMFDPVLRQKVTFTRRFRRFIQIDEYGRRTWFKEFGDPRIIDPTSGVVNEDLTIEEEATSIFYDGHYSPGIPVGVPRWAGAIPALLGAREAEMVNLGFFRDNAIPAMAVLVSGGALTEESYDKIEQYILGVRGQASMNRIVVLEATSEGADAAAIDGSLPAPKVDIKPMLSERQHEGLFQNYVGDAERKGRSSFRLPPIYIGSASEYNRASAFASMLTADQQIFIPERIAWDEMFDQLVLASHNFRFWRLRSAGPGLSDPAEVSRLVATLGAEGAITPNIAIKIANRYLDADIQPIEEEWGDVPFQSSMTAIMAGGQVPGLTDIVQQLTDVMPQETEVTPPGSEEDGVSPVTKMLRRLSEAAMLKMAEQIEAKRLQSIASDSEVIDG